MPGRAYIENMQDQSAPLSLTDIKDLLDAVKALLDAVKAQTDKLAGEAPVGDDVIDDWNTGVATSGNVGADLVTIGAAATRYKVHSLIVSMRNLTAGATVTVRMYQLVNGVEDEVYNQAFTQGVDPDGIWVINAPVGIHEALRVEVHSSAAADDGAIVPYDYMLEAM
jgi:hypothetical protein